jgi:hypothetical protein
MYDNLVLLYHTLAGVPPRPPPTPAGEAGPPHQPALDPAELGPPSAPGAGRRPPPLRVVNLSGLSACPSASSAKPLRGRRPPCSVPSFAQRLSDSPPARSPKATWGGPALAPCRGPKTSPTASHKPQRPQRLSDSPPARSPKATCGRPALGPRRGPKTSPAASRQLQHPQPSPYGAVDPCLQCPHSLSASVILPPSLQFCAAGGELPSSPWSASLQFSAMAENCQAHRR